MDSKDVQQGPKKTDKNKLIESLIKKFEIYLKFSKDKLKITNIFNGFENNVRNDLQTLMYLF